MQVLGQSLLFPTNFRFFAKLPVRFEILVLSRGAQTKNGVGFEVEILGQRLMLRSKIELKLGARYELEKSSPFEFRIVAEKEPNGTTEKKLGDLQGAKNERVELAYEELFTQQTQPSLAEILSLKILEDESSITRLQNKKYLFEFKHDFSLRGLFHANDSGQWTLFLTGEAAQKELVHQLKESLAELSIVSIQIIDATLFQSLAGGALDLTS